MIDPVFDKAPCGYFAFRDDGKLVMVNETLCEWIEAAREDLISKSVETIFTLPTRIFFQTHFFPLIRMQEHAEEIFMSLLSRGGEHIPVLTNASRTQVDGEMMTVCACIRVPNRKKFEDELVMARKAAERANLENTDLIKIKAELEERTTSLEHQMRLVTIQNQELRQFSHVVTHSLNEPLRKIMLYSDMMKREDASIILEKLMRSTRQMKEVLSSLQLYVWLNERTTNFEPVDLNVVFRNAASELPSGFAERLELKMQELTTIEGDAEQLQLLFYHVLKNAVQYRRGEKSFVEVECTTLKQNRYRKVEGHYQYVDFVRLEIIDKGIGFDPDYKALIFELFRKLHSTEGQGVGLALCTKVADNHEGFIEADSKLGERTKITIWLPVRQQ